MPKICSIYTLGMVKICVRYTQDTQTICPMSPKICQRYSEDMPEIIHHPSFIILELLPIPRARSDVLDIPNKGRTDTHTHTTHVFGSTEPRSSITKPSRNHQNANKKWPLTLNRILVHSEGKWWYLTKQIKSLSWTFGADYNQNLQFYAVCWHKQLPDDQTI